MALAKEQAHFLWKCQPEAENLIHKLLKFCIEKSPFLQKLELDLYEKTSTKLFDWLDHLEIGGNLRLEKELKDAGFKEEMAAPSFRSFFHPDAQLPRVVLRDEEETPSKVFIHVDSIAHFLNVRGSSPIFSGVEGSPLSFYRQACVSSENGVFVFVVERRAGYSMLPSSQSAHAVEKILACREKWQTRQRIYDDEIEEEAGIYQAIELAESIVEFVGKGMAASLVLEVEREYWQSKNIAAQVQKNRQDVLGMGWANHDHHTFRSSRKYFYLLVRLFEILGFTCRERFWAGKEAGWGAQVMEHPDVRLVLFLDVDLKDDEVGIDFAHHPLDELPCLGTVGLWCALHGESIMKAGMHHLEAQFDFDKLINDLHSLGISVMAPFTDLPYLKQAFTGGEKWQVAPIRVNRLLERKLITDAQAEKFLTQGAIGSHLENLQRKEGYKGFNQKGVSAIIHKTDPRETFGA